MIPRFTTVVLALAMAAGASAFAAMRDHKITLDDYFTQAYITSSVISPDGLWVAYTEMRWEPPAETRNTELWVVNTKTSATRRLTFDPAADANPQWSDDSRYIYFTSSRGDKDQDPPLNGKQQIWQIPVEGGESKAITRLNDVIDGYEVAADGKSLYYTVSADRMDDEWKELREKFKDVEYGDGQDEVATLWKLDLTTWRSEKLVDDKRHIGSFAVTEDGKRIAMITAQDTRLISNEGEARVDIFETESKVITTLEDSLWRETAPSPFGWLEGLSWTKDGRKLAFQVSFDGYLPEVLVVDWTSGEPKTQKLARVREFTPGDGGSLTWMPNGKDLCVSAIERAFERVLVIRDIANGKQGATQILTPGEIVIEQYSLSSKGDVIAANISDPTNPGDIFVWSTTDSKNKRKLTHVNPQMDSWIMPQMSLVTWKGANGDEVEGVLELPADYQPGKPLPMHVCLHGGPSSNDFMRFEFWIYGKVLFSSQGWAVFSPNYRGSTGYGDEFCSDLVGHENEIEVEDILRGVDAMVERGIADSTRLAVSGWSNGGYLTNCLITQTTRFKAASSGAGVLDMAMQWGTEDTPGHVINYMEGLPWERPDALQKASPLYDLDKVTTPTLIHVGEKDERVPVAHSKALHRGLHDYLNVPTELVVYPGQGHGIMKLTQRRCKMEWDMHWFEKYVLGRQTAAPAGPPQ